MVMVSHVHRFIYLKTRKTAGTSIEMFLQPICSLAGELEIGATSPMMISDVGIVGRRGDKKLPEVAFYNHMPTCDLHKLLGDDIFTSYTKITSIRNPFDRAVSLFHWRERRSLTGNESFATLRGRFRDYILKGDWPDDSEVVFLDGKYIPQQVFRFEHLIDDLQLFMTRLGLPGTMTGLAHEKDLRSARGSQSVSDYYDTDTRDQVLKRLAWVFDHHGYSTNPPGIPTGMIQ